MASEVAVNAIAQRIASLEPTQRHIIMSTMHYEAMTSMLMHQHSPDVRCRVGPSPLHGSGLFAVRDISCGECITHYPAHGFALSNTGRPLSDGGSRLILGATIRRPPNMLEHEDLRLPTEFERSTYNFRVTPMLDIIGYPDMIGSHTLLAHMANDAITTSDTVHNPASEIRYTHAALATNNALIEERNPGIVAMFAKKPIRAGEEITITYGYSYWVSNNKFTGTRP